MGKTDWSAEPGPLMIAKVDPITVSFFQVGDLLKINLADGTVEAPSLEAASEAGRVFVESIRHHLTSTP